VPTKHLGSQDIVALDLRASTRSGSEERRVLDVDSASGSPMRRSSRRGLADAPQE
jgi:hypothetical protein